jgi:hypothetical protein
MKLEFRPVFKFDFKLEAVWPKFKALFAGFKFELANGGKAKRKIVSILSAIILAILIALVLIKVLSAAE